MGVISRYRSIVSILPGGSTGCGGWEQPTRNNVHITVTIKFNMKQKTCAPYLLRDTTNYKVFWRTLEKFWFYHNTRIFFTGHKLKKQISNKFILFVPECPNLMPTSQLVEGDLRAIMVIFDDLEEKCVLCMQLSLNTIFAALSVNSVGVQFNEWSLATTTTRSPACWFVCCLTAHQHYLGYLGQE